MTAVQTETKTAPSFSSAVALAVPRKIYEGKCNASFDNVLLRRKTDPGLLAKDISIIFECGPQSFTFSTSAPWVGDRFPWGLGLVTGSSAWVKEDIEKALDTINANWDDEGGKFWGAVATIKSALKADLDRYCQRN